ncbi:MAG: helix-turn-helix domain-containing protein [Patescibacteria group bacterium]|nr:helix-turn-helix domain-containing protein [Patescibacteria group bacterium]
MMDQLITIKEAAKILGVSIMTLRRWDESGKLPAIRIGETGHRRYKESEILLLTTSLFSLARRWVLSETPQEPEKDFYCQDSSIFKARFDRMESEIQKIPALQETFSLITSSAGEIGNNSFDHNLGNWPDIPGIFYGYDLTKKIVILADRGRGILKTLQQVRPILSNDSEALKVAFTEKLSGRAEKRGNGLKYVKINAMQGAISLDFQTGNAKLNLPKFATNLNITEATNSFHGCLVLIEF